MKTLNLNKLTILFGLFLVSAFFTTSVSAECLKNAVGHIITVNTDSDAPVKDSEDSSTATDQCTDTPDEYEITFYKLGICTASTTGNDLSSCQFILDSAAGVEHIIKEDASDTMEIPNFAIEPGTYPFMVILVSSKLGIKHEMRTTNDVDGSSGDGNGGTYCWTAVAGPSSFTGEATGLVDTAHGTLTNDGVKLIDCGDAADFAAATTIFSYEVITKLSDDDDDSTDPCGTEAWLDYGDRETYAAEGAGASSGIPTISLLTTANAFATSCLNGHKILWTTTLTTPYIVTSESTFELKIRTTEAVSIDFSNDSTDNDIMKMGADPFKVYLTVTD